MASSHLSSCCSTSSRPNRQLCLILRLERLFGRLGRQLWRHRRSWFAWLQGIRLGWRQVRRGQQGRTKTSLCYQNNYKSPLSNDWRTYLKIKSILNYHFFILIFKNTHFVFYHQLLSLKFDYSKSQKVSDSFKTHMKKIRNQPRELNHLLRMAWKKLSEKFPLTRFKNSVFLSFISYFEIPQNRTFKNNFLSPSFIFTFQMIFVKPKAALLDGFEEQDRMKFIWVFLFFYRTYYA